MATIRQRQEQFRQRRLAAGVKRECFWLEPSTQDALTQLRSLHPGTTRDQVVNMALIRLLEHNANLLDSNSVKVLDTNIQPLDTNTKPLDHNAPVDRAALATIAHSWRDSGETLEEVAKRLNESGWTPNAIPLKAGFPPRRNSADQWTLKTISQLLNRDYPKDKDLEATPIIAG